MCVSYIFYTLSLYKQNIIIYLYNLYDYIYVCVEYSWLDPFTQQWRPLQLPCNTNIYLYIYIYIYIYY